MASENIWIYHDDANYVHAISRVLAPLGLTIEVVRRAEEVDRLMTGLAPGDIVIVDLDVPGAGGSGFLGRLRQIGDQVGVVVLTGPPLPEDSLLSTWRQLLRPFDAADLQRAVQALRPRHSQG
jgi:DNA-binding response OmpR family regulator